MRSILPRPLAVLLGACAPLLAVRGDDAAALPSPVRIETAAWLAGCWEGTGLGGTLEECWSPPLGGQMVGHFRLSRDGAPVFYEFLALEEHEGGLRLRVKHFGTDLVGWEEKDASVDFAFDRADADTLAFRGLVIRRTGPDAIAMTLRLRGRDGAVREELLEFVRVEPARRGAGVGP